MKPRLSTINDRLINWGRAARRDPCRPKGATINHLYQQIPHGPDEGHGTITEATIFALRTEPARPEAPDIDEDDAEVMAGWIWQLLPGIRGTLSAVHVLRHELSHADTATSVCKDRYYAAVRALESLIAANYEAVGRLKGLGA